MNDEQPPSKSPSKQSWSSKIKQFLGGEDAIQDQDELLKILKQACKHHLLERDALSMIEGVLQVSKMRVRDIMIPRIQMIVVSKDSELEMVYPLVIESSHSRFPVIEDDRSQVIGILMAKDLLTHILGNKKLCVKDIMRPANIVPESKRLNVLLKEFRTERNHMAIVVDEYGMAAGLVTIEDVLEQIVGEIEDEHDVDDSEGFIQELSRHEFVLKGLTPIDEFNNHFSANLQDEGFDTISGFVVHKLGHLPKKGEKLEINNFCFEIMRADSRRLYLIKLKLKN